MLRKDVPFKEHELEKNYSKPPLFSKEKFTAFSAPIPRAFSIPKNLTFEAKTSSPLLFNAVPDIPIKEEVVCV